MNPDDKILLYLYKDIGLYWERVLSKEDERERCSQLTNKGLNTLIRSGKISLTVTTLDNVDSIQLHPGHMACTDTQSSKFRSLIHHLRNSIMHGMYEITMQGSMVWISFEDVNRRLDRTTLRGQIELIKLQEMMNIIKNYKG
jgi:hypothetical protein